MGKLSFPHDEAVQMFAAQVEEFVAACEGMDDLALLEPSRCRGWSRLDLLTHVRLGLEEMAVGSTNHSAEEADHDAASYWTGYAEKYGHEDPVPGILWLRRVASAYVAPSRAVAHLRASAEAAVGAVRAMPEGAVSFQGMVLASGDFLGTWAVEVGVHWLDLDIEGAPRTTDWARQTLETIADAPLPDQLSGSDAVLVGLGRVACPCDMVLPVGYPLTL